MDIRLRIFVMIVSCFAFYIVISKLIKRQLNESSSILWLLIGFITFIAGVFPNIINWLAALIGIDYPPTLLFLVSTIMLMLITFKNSIDISKIESRLSEVAIIVSILKEDNHRLNMKVDGCLGNVQETNEGSENL